jgi:hypothetical protein
MHTLHLRMTYITGRDSNEPWINQIQFLHFMDTVSIYVFWLVFCIFGFSSPLPYSSDYFSEIYFQNSQNNGISYLEGSWRACYAPGFSLTKVNWSNKVAYLFCLAIALAEKLPAHSGATKKYSNFSHVVPLRFQDVRANGSQLLSNRQLAVASELKKNPEEQCITHDISPHSWPTYGRVKFQSNKEDKINKYYFMAST